MMILIGIAFIFIAIGLLVFGFMECDGEAVKFLLSGGVISIIIGLCCLESAGTQDIQQQQLEGKLPYEIGRVVQWKDGTTETIPMGNSLRKYRKQP